MPKRIILQAIENLRDVGGYPCTYGETAYGLLFRCAAIDKATKEDVDKLAQLGIKTIIDLRGKAASDSHPDVTIGDSRFNNVAINIDPGSSFAMTPQLMQALSQHPTLAQALIQSGGSFENMSDMYRSSPEDIAKAKMMFEALSQAGFTFGLKEMIGMYFSVACDLESAKKVFLALLNKQKPILIHCTAGKDRTGIFVALLLLLNGVPLEDVNADYLASYPYLYGQGKMINDEFADFVLFKPNLTLIPTVIKTIEGKFGSLLGYFSALGLTEEEISRLSVLLK